MSSNFLHKFITRIAAARKFQNKSLTKITNIPRITTAYYSLQPYKYIAPQILTDGLSKTLAWLFSIVPASFVFTLSIYELSLFFYMHSYSYRKEYSFFSFQRLHSNAIDELRKTIASYCDGSVCLPQRTRNWWKQERTTQKCLHKLHLLWSKKQHLQSLALTKRRRSWNSQVYKTTLKDNYIFCWNKEKSCTPVCEVAIANSQFPAFQFP